MKKAKIMLTAMAVLATVGGALAFKAHKAFSGGNIYTNNPVSPFACTVLNTTLTFDAGGSLLVTGSSISKPGIPCTVQVPVRLVD